MQASAIKFHTRNETLEDEKQHDVADKSTPKQQVCVSDSSHLRHFVTTVVLLQSL